MGVDDKNIFLYKQTIKVPWSGPLRWKEEEEKTKGKWEKRKREGEKGRGGEREKKNKRKTKQCFLVFLTVFNIFLHFSFPLSLSLPFKVTEKYYDQHGKWRRHQDISNKPCWWEIQKKKKKKTENREKPAFFVSLSFSRFSLSGKDCARAQSLSFSHQNDHTKLSASEVPFTFHSSKLADTNTNFNISLFCFLSFLSFFTFFPCIFIIIFFSNIFQKFFLQCFFLFILFQWEKTTQKSQTLFRFTSFLFLNFYLWYFCFTFVVLNVYCNFLETFSGDNFLSDEFGPLLTDIGDKSFFVLLLTFFFFFLSLVFCYPAT